MRNIRIDKFLTVICKKRCHQERFARVRWALRKRIESKIRYYWQRRMRARDASRAIRRMNAPGSGATVAGLPTVNMAM